VVLDGSTLPSASIQTGLSIAADGCRVAGLAINGFSGSGLQVRGFGNHIEGCFIGTDRWGQVPLQNGGHGIALLDGGDNVVGGFLPEHRNVISANGNNGVYITRSARNTVVGNLIGTGADGVSSMGNNNGIVFGGGSGGTKDNFIGSGSVLGRNVISGNDRVGIIVGGSGAAIERTRILGNYIGTNVSGTGPVPNGLYGIQLSVALETQIGSFTHTTGTNGGNVISASGSAGIFMATGTKRTRVWGNLIGTTVDGRSALGNDFGIRAGGGGVEDNLIGGGTSGKRNVISGNRIGVSLGGEGNDLINNRIGTDTSGVLPLGNTEGGVVLAGLDQEVSNNRIHHNAGIGVTISGGAGQSVLGNSIRDNTGLGIDIAPSGVNPIDPGDGDSGPNGSQNAPTLRRATWGGSTALVRLELVSRPWRSYRVEFFVSRSCDSTGFGEGDILRRVIAVPLGPTGRAVFATQVTGAAPGTHVTATMTDMVTGDTSEFSNCVIVEPIPRASSSSFPGGTPL